MICPASGDVLIESLNENGDRVIRCPQNGLEFPKQLQKMIEEAVDRSESVTVLSRPKRKGSGAFRCPNCNNDLVVKGSKFHCNRCELSIPLKLQHYLQNRLGHS